MSVSGGDEPSFDPRSWGAKPAQPSGAEPAKVESPAPAKLAATDRRGLLIGGGAAALVAVSAGGWLALRGRGPGAATVPASVATPAAPTAPVAGMRRSMVIAGIEGLPEAVVGAGLGSDVASRITQAARGALGAQTGELRVLLSLSQAATPQFLQIDLRRADGSGVRIRPTGDTLAVQPLVSDLQAKVKVVRGEMDASSFYSSAVSAGVTDSLITDFANAFAFDFDFQREIRPGDIFEAAFAQSVTSAGQAVGDERLVYASLQTAAKSRAFYRFQPQGETAPSWFDSNGSSIVRSLMRTPVEGARISSTFGPRMHPVLGFTRIHKGTDFATPVGTKVYASGPGVIDFMGVHGGHGNYISIRHSPTLQTAYAHLSVYGAGMAVGAKVSQGQEIALSGNTGLSSGPHLHYEVIVNGEQVDSMTYQTASGRVLAADALAAFRRERDRIDGLRAAQNG